MNVLHGHRLRSVGAIDGVYGCPKMGTSRTTGDEVLVCVFRQARTVRDPVLFDGSGDLRRRGLRWLLRRLFSLELCDAGGALITGSLFLLESGQPLRCSSSLLQRRAGKKIFEDVRFDCPTLASLGLSTPGAFLPAFAMGNVFVYARQLLY